MMECSVLHSDKQSCIGVLIWQWITSALWRSNIGLTFDTCLAFGLMPGAPKVWCRVQFEVAYISFWWNTIDSRASAILSLLMFVSTSSNVIGESSSRRTGHWGMSVRTVGLARWWGPNTAMFYLPLVAILPSSISMAIVTFFFVVGHGATGE